MIIINQIPWLYARYRPGIRINYI